MVSPPYEVILWQTVKVRVLQAPRVLDVSLASTLDWG